MKINASILTLLSQNQQEKSVFQLLNQILLIKKGEHVPIVHTHLEDKVRYGDLGFSIQREGKTSSKHLLWQLFKSQLAQRSEVLSAYRVCQRGLVAAVRKSRPSQGPHVQR